MASISANGSKGHHKFTLTVTQSGTNVANNTSTISFDFKLSPIQTSWNWEYSSTVPVSYTITINGTTYTGNIMIYDGSSIVTVKSGTQTVTHNADGTKAISYSFSVTSLDVSYLTGSASASGSLTLSTIPRATTPTFSAKSVTMGNSITITLKPAASTFKHKVDYTWAGYTYQTAGVSSGANFTAQGNTTVTFTPPVALANNLPYSTSGVCKVICYTYNSSGTLIGSVETSITLVVPSYTLTASLTITGNNLLSGVYVQNKSSMNVSIAASTSYGATITGYSSVVDNTKYTGQNFTTNFLSNGSKTVVTTVTDSRGKTVQVTSAAYIVYAYTTPQITSFSLERQSNGTSVIATVKGSISAINNKNAKTVKVVLNGVTNTITSSAYTINGTTTFTNVPTDVTLIGSATLADSYVTIKQDSVLPTVAVTMDFYKDGNGIAMGKVAETPNLLDVVWDIKTGGNLNVGKTANITGDLLVNGDFTLGGLNLLNHAKTKWGWGKNTVLYNAQTVANSYGNTLSGASITLEANSTYLVLVGIMASDGSQTSYSDILLANVETGGEILISCSGRSGAYAGGGVCGFGVVKTTSSTFVRCQSHGYKNATFNLYMRTVAIKLDT